MTDTMLKLYYILKCSLNYYHLSNVYNHLSRLQEHFGFCVGQVRLFC